MELSEKELEVVRGWLSLAVADRGGDAFGDNEGAALAERIAGEDSQVRYWLDIYARQTASR